MWHHCWCRTSMFECFRNCPGISTHYRLHGLRRMVGKRANQQWVVLWMKMTGRGHRTMAKLVRADRNSNSNNYLSQLRYAEGHLWMHNTLNLEANGLQQQQKTTPEASTVSKDCTGWPKFDNRRLKKCCLVWSVDLLRHSDGRVRIWCKHESVGPSCLFGSGRWCWCNGA